MKFILGLAIMVSSIAASAFAGPYTHSRDLDKAHTKISLYDVKFAVVATKTEVRRIPGCDYFGRQNHEVCLETVIVESMPAVEVTVKYREGVFTEGDERLNKKFFPLYLAPASFSAAALADLKSGNQTERLAWAETNLDFQANLVTRNVQIVDVANSTLCTAFQSNRYPAPIPGCVEVLNYKTVQRAVTEVSVNVK